MTKRNHKKQIKKARRFRCFLSRMPVLLLCFLLVHGGFDYYQNQNIDKTLQLLSNLYEGVQEIPDTADWLLTEGERTIRELTGNLRSPEEGYSLEDIPEYSGEPYVEINHNIPDFNEDERSSGAFEYYSELDSLGRCGMAEAMITQEIMPTEERGQIGSVKPTGWHTVKYDVISDSYLYNRCHLIAFELSGENANEQNLITGTRYMNVNGMLPWENKVAQYVKRTDDKVIYRVTPVFVGDELVARGVHMEAESMGSDEIQFNIFVYNVQPGIGIDYTNGDSWQEQ